MNIIYCLKLQPATIIPYAATDDIAKIVPIPNEKSAITKPHHMVSRVHTQ